MAPPTIATKLEFAPDEPLDTRLLAVSESLTKKQAALARFIADHKVALAFASVDEVGRQTGVDAATVVRFSRMLGYDGFADLRESVRASVPQFLSAMEKIRTSEEGDQPASELLASVAEADIQNITEIATVNTSDAIADAIAAINAARRTYVVGFGMSAYVSATLAQQLSLVGVPVSRPSGGAIAAAADLAGVGSTDVVVAVSIWRHLRDPVRFLAAAQRVGAATIGISDSRLSPLAHHAEVMLAAPTGTPELAHSVTALITLTQVIATGVATANRERTVESLRKIEEFTDEGPLWAEM